MSLEKLTNPEIGMKVFETFDRVWYEIYNIVYVGYYEPLLVLKDIRTGKIIKSWWPISCFLMEDYSRENDHNWLQEGF